MKNSDDVLFRNKWLFLDQSMVGLRMNPMHSFAMDDTLCRFIASQPQTGIARAWVHDRTVVLGIQDSRLPFVSDGIAFLREEGYEVIIRNSGGLAVVLDAEILNVSLIFSDTAGLSIDNGYQLMVGFAKLLLPELSGVMKDGEVSETYCPGRFDLSVDGKKFAGISQRRLRGGVAVQMYLAVDGSGSKRAELIRGFYQRAASVAETKFSYPRIIPAKMASLNELSGVGYTIRSLTERMLYLLNDLSDQLDMHQLSTEYWEIYQDNLERMMKRNEKINGNIV